MDIKQATLVTSCFIWETTQMGLLPQATTSLFLALNERQLVLLECKLQLAMRLPISLAPPFLPVIYAPTCFIYFQTKHVTFSDPIYIKYKLLTTTHSVTTSLKTLSVSNHHIKNISIKISLSKIACICQPTYLCQTTLLNQQSVSNFLHLCSK